MSHSKYATNVSNLTKVIQPPLYMWNNLK